MQYAYLFIVCRHSVEDSVMDALWWEEGKYSVALCLPFFQSSVPKKVYYFLTHISGCVVEVPLRSRAPLYIRVSLKVGRLILP
jgi:hypothetical protein